MSTDGISEDQARDVLKRWLFKEVESLVDGIEVIESHQGPGGYMDNESGCGHDDDTEECFVFPIIERGRMGATRTVIISKETGKVLYDGMLGR